MTSAAPSSGYDLFAEVYSVWMAGHFCQQAWPAIEHQLLTELPPGARVLDLCCGSGQMARALVEHGFQVTGVDASSEMLRLARANAPAADFLLADARDFLLPLPCTAAISTFNSLAHIETGQDLERVFRCVRAALLPGGRFLFDLSTEEAYSSKWRGTLSLVTAESACILQPSFDPSHRVGRNHVTLFRPRQGGGWDRHDFCIEQKCHPEADVRDALLTAGFTSIATHDAQHDLGIAGEAGRMFFLCA